MNALDYDIVPQKSFDDTSWLRYFRPREALAAVAAHVAALPSSRTDERHTEKVYEAGLKYFLGWSDRQLPTESLLTAYVGHLVHDKDLKSTTISSKYMAPVRLYLKKLAGQLIPVTGAERDFVQDCREHIRAATQVKSPRQETTTNIAPLWRAEFKRLSLNQVNAVLRQIDRFTVIGLRDYALLHVAFSTGLRLAELARITPESFTREGDVWLITVRGKRSNSDPVPIGDSCLSDIVAYIDAYNRDLPDDDPRRIPAVGMPSMASGSALWQPLQHGDNHAIIGTRGYAPARGLSHNGIRNIIRKRTAAALGESNALAAHDTRRTAAAIAYDHGMTLPDIQALLRHKDAAVTLRYIGTKPDYETRSLENYVKLG